MNSMDVGLTRVAEHYYQLAGKGVAAMPLPYPTNLVKSEESKMLTDSSQKATWGSTP